MNDQKSNPERARTPSVGEIFGFAKSPEKNQGAEIQNPHAQQRSGLPGEVIAHHADRTDPKHEMRRREIRLMVQAQQDMGAALERVRDQTTHPNIFAVDENVTYVDFGAQQNPAQEEFYEATG